MTIFATQLRTLLRVLEAYGVNPAQVIPAELYRPGVPSSRSERLSLAVVDDLMKQALGMIDDPAFGLKTSEYLHPSHLGALGHAWMASASLRDALQRSQRYHRMLNERLRIELTDGDGMLKASYSLTGEVANPDVHADIYLSWAMRLCRFNFGQELVPAFVRMRRPEPADPAPWRRCFGVDVQFGRAENCLAIHQADADRALTSSSPELVAVHEEIMLQHLARMERTDIVNRARAVIMDQLPSGRVTEDSVAASLNMSPRTLYNNLRKHGTAFRELILELRKDLAQRYLSEPGYSLTEISFMLGFSDSSSFSRAFKSWFGMSPSRYRETLG